MKQSCDQLDPQYKKPFGWRQDAKESSGFSPVQSQIQYANISRGEIFRSELFGPPDNKKKERPPPISTGKSAWRSPRRSLYQELLESLEEESMPSSPVPKRPLPIARRPTQDSRNLSMLGPDPFVEIQRPIGSPYGPPPSPEILNPFPQMSEWSVIVPCELLDLTTPSQKPLIEGLMSFGVVQILANHVVLGMKQEKVLMLNVLDPSSGTVIKIRSMLSSMNFAEVAMWHTCSDGSIVTHAVWKSKALPDPLMLNEFGLQAMWIQDYGIQI